MSDKIRSLGEYYRVWDALLLQYHRDVPRIFAEPAVRSLNKYHDKKRRIEYNRITAMLGKKGVPPVPAPPLPKELHRVLNAEYDAASIRSIFKRQVSDSSLVSLMEIRERLSQIVVDASYTAVMEQTRADISKVFNPGKVQSGELMKIYHRFLAKNQAKKQPSRIGVRDVPTKEPIKEPPTN
jgi:hypothetical protein